MDPPHHERDWEVLGDQRESADEYQQRVARYKVSSLFRDDQDRQFNATSAEDYTRHAIRRLPPRRGKGANENNAVVQDVRWRCGGSLASDATPYASCSSEAFHDHHKEHGAAVFPYRVTGVARSAQDNASSTGLMSAPLDEGYCTVYRSDTQYAFVPPDDASIAQASAYRAHAGKVVARGNSSSIRVGTDQHTDADWVSSLRTDFVLPEEERRAARSRPASQASAGRHLKSSIERLFDEDQQQAYQSSLHSDFPAHQDSGRRTDLAHRRGDSNTSSLVLTGAADAAHYATTHAADFPARTTAASGQKVQAASEAKQQRKQLYKTNLPDWSADDEQAGVDPAAAAAQRMRSNSQHSYPPPRQQDLVRDKDHSAKLADYRATHFTIRETGAAAGKAAFASTSSSSYVAHDAEQAAVQAVKPEQSRFTVFDNDVDDSAMARRTSYRTTMHDDMRDAADAIAACPDKLYDPETTRRAKAELQRSHFHLGSAGDGPSYTTSMRNDFLPYSKQQLAGRAKKPGFFSGATKLTGDETQAEAAARFVSDTQAGFTAFDPQARRSAIRQLAGRQGGDQSSHIRISNNPGDAGRWISMAKQHFGQPSDNQARAAAAVLQRRQAARVRQGYHQEHQRLLDGKALPRPPHAFDRAAYHDKVAKQLQESGALRGA